MSAPDGPHAPDTLRDSGYGVRYYAAGMSIGYDWLYPALGTSLRKRVATAIERWLGDFERAGFERQFPQGNYFAGYYAAKAYAGIALSGDTAGGATLLADWRDRIQSGLVQPYYAANLAGGGWPEGWNYGPIAGLNMSLPALAARTAIGRRRHSRPGAAVRVSARQSAISPLFHVAEHDHARGLLGALLERRTHRSRRRGCSRPRRGS